MRNTSHALQDSGTETHITSLVVHALPGRAESVGATLGDIAEVEVHTVHQNGKLVVLVESKTLNRVTELIEQIGALPGVVDATLVYHQIEDSAALDEPVDAGGTHADSTQLKEPAS